jgi:hypothetical protein
MRTAEQLRSFFADFLSPEFLDQRSAGQRRKWADASVSFCWWIYLWVLRFLIGVRPIPLTSAPLKVDELLENQGASLYRLGYAPSQPRARYLNTRWRSVRPGPFHLRLWCKRAGGKA